MVNSDVGFIYMESSHSLSTVTAPARACTCGGRELIDVCVVVVYECVEVV